MSVIVVRNLSHLKESLKKLRGEERLLDIETTGLHFMVDEIESIQIGDHKHQIIIDTNKFTPPQLTQILKPILESRRLTKVIHNALFDCCFLEYHYGVKTVVIHDTMLTEKVLIANTIESASLGASLSRHGIIDLDKDKDFMDVTYRANDIKYLGELKKSQLAQASEKDLRIIDLENRTVEVTIAMRFQGLCFDKDKWIEIAKANEEEYNKRLKKMPKSVTNWGSEKQVKNYFREEHGIIIDSYKNLESIGNELPKKNKVFDQFMDLRKHYQDVSLFGMNWLTVKMNTRAPIQIEDTVMFDRVHGNFNQILETGRYSSVQPNLQQLRKGGEHRECFIANRGTKFIISDYPGQELAIAAVAAGQKDWIDLMMRGESVHDLMAYKLFGKGYTEHDRFMAKKINFAILYGSGAKVIAAELKIPLREARILRMRWKKAVPAISKHLEKLINMAERHKESYSLYGRRRDFKHYQKRGSTYTVAQNNPIQATGADMLKLAMVKTHEAFQGLNLDARIALCVHDELIVEAANKYVTKAKKIVKECMDEAAKEILGIGLIKVKPYIANKWEKEKS